MTKLILAALAAVILLFAGCSSMTTVDAREIGIWKRYGAVQAEVAQPGLHFKNPFTTSLIMMSTETARWNAETQLLTGDNQAATVRFTVTYRLDPSRAIDLYRSAQNEWDDRFIPPATFRIVQDEFGRWTANAAVSRRPVIQTNIYNRLRAQLAQRGILIEGFDMTAVGYSEAFMDAVEAAQTATQQAIRARNQTVTITEQARQRVITAQSEAESIRVQAQAITENPAIVQLRAVEKWDGHLPQNMYGGAAVPFVDVSRR